LVSAGLVEPVHTEPGDAGPVRVVQRLTPAGKKQLQRWLGQPVHHVREIRIEFQLKLTLLRRSGKSPLALIRKQRAVLEPTIAALHRGIRIDGEPDHVELWRQHNAAAAGSYLDHLETIYRGG
jgi:PadR family transcriptional regulator AphA